MVSSPVPRAVNREIARSRTPIHVTRVIVGAPPDQQDGGNRCRRERGQVKTIQHLPAVSAATTECRGPYSGMGA